MKDCLFCKIIKKEIPSEIVYQDESLTVIKDINPAAPIHLLIIPNKHIVSVQEMEPGDEEILGKLFSAAKKAAEAEEAATAEAQPAEAVAEKA